MPDTNRNNDDSKDCDAAPSSAATGSLLSADDKITLMRLAFDSVEYGVRFNKAPVINITDYSKGLRELRATFVTLKHQKSLVGCIGTLQAIRPLAEDVSHNAFAAGFEDPRFPGVTRSQLSGLDIHISILSPSERMVVKSEEDLLKQIRVGIDGLILQEGFKRATFLPAVWEMLPEPVLFLAHLKRKAGLPDNYWSDDMEFSRYTCESFP